MNSSARSLLALCGCAILAGCAMAPVTSSAPGSIPAVRGVVHGGQQPISGATVQVWAAGATTNSYGSGAQTLGDPVLTASDGTFTYGSYTCPSANTPVYITAAGGDAGGGTNGSIVLAAGLGNCVNAPSETVIVNEITTAATAYALGQFFNSTLSAGYTNDLIGGPITDTTQTYNLGLALQNTSTIPRLVDLTTGSANTGYTSGNTVATIESAKLIAVANVLASCVNTADTQGGGTSSPSSSCASLFSLTTPPTGATRSSGTPSDTLQAAVQMVLYPYDNVPALYNLIPAQYAFAGGLTTAPNDWTLAVAYNSPSFGLGINYQSASNIDIDASGNVWFPTNTPTAHGVAEFEPSTGLFSTTTFAASPNSTNATVSQPQYLAIDTTGNVFVTDLANGTLTSTPTSAPAATGTAYTFPGASVSSGPISIDRNGYPLLAYSDGTSFRSAYAQTTAVNNIATFDAMPLDVVTDYGNEVNPGAGNFYTDALIGVLSPTGFGSCETEYSDLYSSSSSVAGTPSTHLGVTAPSGCDYISSIAATTGVSDHLATYYGGSSSTTSLFEVLNGETVTTAAGLLNEPESIATDGRGNLWIANFGNGSVATLGYTGGQSSASFVQTSPIPYLHNSANGNTMTDPIAVAIDASGNVWVSMAGCTSNQSQGTCTPGSYTLSTLVGAAAPTITPLAAQGIYTGYMPGTTPIN